MENKIVIYNGIEFPNYIIYEDGRVFSIKSNIFIKERFHSGGYKMVTLFNPKQKDCFIHRLVACAFIPNIFNKRCINHIDGNKENNNRYNLEWCTDSENQKYSYANGLNSRNGLNNGQSKLNPEIVSEIRSSKLPTKELAIKFKVSNQSINAVKSYKSWV